MYSLVFIFNHVKSIWAHTNHQIAAKKINNSNWFPDIRTEVASRLNANKIRTIAAKHKPSKTDTTTKSTYPLLLWQRADMTHSVRATQQSRSHKVYVWARWALKGIVRYEVYSCQNLSINWLVNLQKISCQLFRKSINHFSLFSSKNITHLLVPAGS